MITRKKTGKIFRYSMFLLLYLPYHILNILTKWNWSMNRAYRTYSEIFIDSIIEKIEAWENNSPEGTMERLRKNYRK